MKLEMLKKILESYPEDLDVYVLCEGYGNAFLCEREDIRLEPGLADDGTKQICLVIGKE